MKIKFSLMFLCALLAFAAQAHADLIGISPDSGDLNVTRWLGPETSQAEINTAIAPIIGTAVELYKQNVNEPETNLPLKDSYDTVYSLTPDDPSGATITYTGGDFVGATAYLLVKDGKNSPGWYLFDLTALGWLGNQTQDLVLSDFWPEQGAISHVALYGTLEEGGQPIPEPVSMLLFGTGLVGIGGYIRRKFKK